MALFVETVLTAASISVDKVWKAVNAAPPPLIAAESANKSPAAPAIVAIVPEPAILVRFTELKVKVSLAVVPEPT